MWRIVHPVTLSIHKWTKFPILPMCLILLGPHGSHWCLKHANLILSWFRCAVLGQSVLSDSCDPMNCSPPGSSVHGIFQTRILEWVAMSSSRKSSQPRNWSWVSEVEALTLRPPDAKSWVIGIDPDAGKDWGQEKKGTTEDEMVGWHHRLNGHEFEQTPGDGEGQGSLVCCSPWGHRDIT